MKNVISKHKIEIVYIVVILLMIIYGTVTAYAEVSSNIAEEPQIVIETDVEEEPQKEVVEDVEEEPQKEVVEDVESETIDKEVSENTADMVVNELSPEEQQQVENGDLSELIDIMKTIVTLLFVEIVGIGLLFGSILCREVFKWLA